VKILGQGIGLGDFIPPIFVRSRNKIKSWSDGNSKAKEDLTIRPFISPCLKSYSQFHEDLIIDFIMDFKEKGFYIDIGANDPILDSNTKRFYDRGWTGINIEPGRDSFEKLCLSRPKDINLNIGIGPMNGNVTFYQVIENPQVSSFDKELSKIAAEKSGWTIKEIEIEVCQIVDVFERYVNDKHVDFMSVDAESLDLEVLQGNNWTRFRPTILIVEIDKRYKKIIDYMLQCDYMLIYNNEYNGIFVDKNTPDCYLRNMVD
jgi:FkbM family methyltransferase